MIFLELKSLKKMWQKTMQLVFEVYKAANNFPET